MRKKSGQTQAERIASLEHQLKTKTEANKKLQQTLNQMLAGEARRNEERDHLQKENVILRKLATTDPLTEVQNLRGFEQSMAKFLSRIERNENYPEAGIGEKKHVCGTLVFVDINSFKPINELFSHEAGNIALMKFAHCLKHTIRPNDYIGRVGGDEFAVLLKGVSDITLAKKIIAKAQHEVHKITLDEMEEDPAHAKLFYQSVGRDCLLDFDAGYFVVNNAQLDTSALLAVAERRVKKYERRA